MLHRHVKRYFINLLTGEKTTIWAGRKDSHAVPCVFGKNQKTRKRSADNKQGDTTMNIKHIELVVHMRFCPKCTIGMTRELAAKVYRCDYSMCNETYDYSHLSDETIKMLFTAPTAGAK